MPFGCVYSIDFNHLAHQFPVLAHAVAFSRLAATRSDVFALTVYVANRVNVMLKIKKIIVL